MTSRPPYDIDNSGAERIDPADAYWVHSYSARLRDGHYVFVGGAPSPQEQNRAESLGLSVLGIDIDPSGISLLDVNPDCWRHLAIYRLRWAIAQQRPWGTPREAKAAIKAQYAPRSTLPLPPRPSPSAGPGSLPPVSRSGQITVPETRIIA